jgi:D-arabinose 1-dehydrogenase-like Zn-dependent alcohol dehydrogenase
VNAADELQRAGGARVILATAPNSKAMNELVGGLSSNGKLLVIGVSFDPLGIAPIQLISGQKSLQGWVSGKPADEEDTLRFCDLSGIRPMIETFPLEEAAAAYARMMSGRAQFRVALTT